jgi:hypothetical protein
MFTPQDIIDAYRAKNLKPVFMRFGLGFSSLMVFEPGSDRCTCAISALAVGSPIVSGPVEWAEREYPGLDAWAFIDGFDARPYYYTRGGAAEESYELGRQCRLAVLEAFPETEALTPAE